MRYVATCSGGKDSVATLLLIKEHSLPVDEVVYVEMLFNSQVSADLPSHKEFVLNKLKPWVEQELNVPFIHLIANSSLEQLFFKVKTSKSKHEGKINGFMVPWACWLCEIKKRTLQTYIGNAIQYVGIAADEPERLARLEKYKNKVSLLAKYRVSEARATILCMKNKLLSPIYDDCSRTGCWFCPNRNDKQWISLWHNNKDLVNLLFALEKEPNQVNTKFTREETVSELFDRIKRIPKFKKLW